MPEPVSSSLCPKHIWTQTNNRPTCCNAGSVRFFVLSSFNHDYLQKLNLNNVHRCAFTTTSVGGRPFRWSSTVNGTTLYEAILDQKNDVRALVVDRTGKAAFLFTDTNQLNRVRASYELADIQSAPRSNWDRNAPKQIARSSRNLLI